MYGSVKWDDKKLKVLYRVYDYNSNPKLNDTDFDGLLDSSENEGFELNNKFVGVLLLKMAICQWIIIMISGGL